MTGKEHPGQHQLQRAIHRGKGRDTNRGKHIIIIKSNTKEEREGCSEGELRLQSEGGKQGREGIRRGSSQQRPPHSSGYITKGERRKETRRSRKEGPRRVLVTRKGGGGWSHTCATLPHLSSSDAAAKVKSLKVEDTSVSRELMMDSRADSPVNSSSKCFAEAISSYAFPPDRPRPLEMKTPPKRVTQ